MSSVLDRIRAALRVEQAAIESETERYGRIDIDFTKNNLKEWKVGGTDDVELQVTGDYIAKVLYTGNVGNASFRLNTRNARELKFSETRKIYSKFTRLYISNRFNHEGAGDVTGKITLVIGGALSGEIEPAGGGEVGILNSVNARIDPLKEEGAITIIDAHGDPIDYGMGDTPEASPHGFVPYGIRKDAAAPLAAANKFIPQMFDATGHLYVKEKNSIAAPATAANQVINETTLTAIETDIAALEVDLAAIEVLATDMYSHIETIKENGDPDRAFSEELVAVGSGGADTFPAQVLKRGCEIVVNDMGTNTWIDITLGGHAVRCDAVGQGIAWIPIFNANEISVLGDNAADDGKVVYIGV